VKAKYCTIHNKNWFKKTSTQKTALTVKNAFLKKNLAVKGLKLLYYYILFEKNNGFLQIVR